MKLIEIKATPQKKKKKYLFNLKSKLYQEVLATEFNHAGTDFMPLLSSSQPVPAKTSLIFPAEYID